MSYTSTNGIYVVFKNPQAPSSIIAMFGTTCHCMQDLWISIRVLAQQEKYFSFKHSLNFIVKEEFWLNNSLNMIH